MQFLCKSSLNFDLLDLNAAPIHRVWGLVLVWHASYGAFWSEWVWFQLEKHQFTSLMQWLVDICTPRMIYWYVCLYIYIYIYIYMCVCVFTQPIWLYVHWPAQEPQWPDCLHRHGHGIGKYIIKMQMLTVSRLGFASSKTCLAWPTLH